LPQLPNNADAVVRGPIHASAKRCYQQGLRADPSQAGRVVIRIHVAPDGSVDQSAVTRNDGLARSVAECIADGARGVRFDAPGDSGATINIPFNFVRGNPVDAGPRGAMQVDAPKG
jgi:hypothetical protein